MKKCKLIFVLVIVLAIVYGWNLNNDKSVNDVLIGNIEALANPENANYVCYGYGSIDCPVTNSKVYGVIKAYGMGF